MMLFNLRTKNGQTSWLPPLGYSPQFAAFNRILLAVGHHVLQPFISWWYITL
ncbi:hypothetical protein [Aeromonas veronii]|uniref:hypothetical protein n=1 Tax=Aeromonas veronii TaxID=654 RepID=UPI0018F10C32|nr:hypothetical protein [Aeromonas veronii]MBJ7591791.1 hypothetical protein [Aeromonas veronii]